MHARVESQNGAGNLTHELNLEDNTECNNEYMVMNMRTQTKMKIMTMKIMMIIIVIVSMRMMTTGALPRLEMGPCLGLP